MPYEPRAGTLPHRAIEHLKSLPEGTELSTNDFCAALGMSVVEAKSFGTWMRPARDAGVLRARTKDGQGRNLFWSLGDGTPASEPEADDPPKFHFCVHSDGDIDLHGLQELENGGHRMTKEMVRELRRMIAWMPAQ